MSLDTKHDDLQSLRIDRSHRSDSDGEPPKWAKRYILGGIAVVVLLSLIALVYRLVSPSAAEVEVVRRATAANDKITLDRTRELFGQGVVSKQALDDATAKYESDQNRMNSLNQAFALSKLGPRAEEIGRAKGALMQAEGQAAYAKSLLDATTIRAPVTGTILERKVEKGELLTAQFASTA